MAGLSSGPCHVALAVAGNRLPSMVEWSDDAIGKSLCRVASWCPGGRAATGGDEHLNQQKSDKMKQKNYKA